MELSEKTKKILLYGGGAASILGVFLYLRNKSASERAASGFAPSGAASGGGASGDAASAAQINAATQLAIAEGNRTAQAAQLDAAVRIAGIQSNAQIQAASIGASGARAAAMTGALGQVLSSPATSTGGKAVGGLFDFLGGLVSKIFGGKTASDLGFVGEANPPIQIASENAGWIAPGSSFLTPAVYGIGGNFQSVGFSTATSDYYQGSIGSGGASWFGTSPGEEFQGYNYTPGTSGFIGPVAEPTGESTPGIPAGYQD
jgi:hypothetical protein